jgi:hypothetical protein
MAGSDKKAARLSKHLGEPVDAACSISPPGSTALQAGGAVGGAIGAGIAQAGAPKKGGTVNIGRFAWLGLGADGFTVTGADALLGRPKGEPVIRAGYGEVSTTVTKGKVTLRADVELADGDVLSFEVKRIGPANKPSVQVVELFAERCGAEVPD